MCGRLVDAEKVFDDMREANVVSWNALMSAYVQSAQSAKALQLFDQMHQEAIIPDKISYVSILTACSCDERSAKGKHLHTCIVNNGFESSVVLCNALITFYGKIGGLQEAQKMFDLASERDLVSWNAMIAAYSKHGLEEAVLHLLKKMQCEGVNIDKVTLVAIIDLCTNGRALAQGKKLHTFMLDNRIEMDVVVATSLLNMYVKCNSLETARMVFNTVRQRSVITWNSMLTGYLHVGDYEQVLQLFHQMQCEGEVLDEAVVATLMSACSIETCIAEGKRVHACVLNSDRWLRNACSNALVAMYAMCGALEVACAVFLENVNPDQVSWSTLISAYSQHGKGLEALRLHSEMPYGNVASYKATSVCLLSACSHAGLLHEGHRFLLEINGNYPRTVTAEHFDCLLDLLGRAGLLDHAEDIFSHMPYQPTDVSCLTLLSACKHQLDVVRAEWAAKHLFELGQEEVSACILLSTIFTVAGRVCDKDKLGISEIVGCKRLIASI